MTNAANTDARNHATRGTLKSEMAADPALRDDYGRAYREEWAAQAGATTTAAEYDRMHKAALKDAGDYLTQGETWIATETLGYADALYDCARKARSEA